MPELAMIIEDDEDLSEIFGQALTAANFNILIVRDGTIAQSRLRETCPDIVILDMHLPNISGSDLLRQIREDPRLSKTKVVITTADALTGEALRNQADLVLIKPITFTQLRDLTNRLHR